jgi:hypothetical protein
MSSIIGGTPFYLNVNLVALATEHLPTTAGTTLNITPPMVEVTIQSTAIRTALTGFAPALLAVSLALVFLAVTEYIVSNAAFGGEHLSTADFTLGHYSTTFRQESSPKMTPSPEPQSQDTWIVPISSTMRTVPLHPGISFLLWGSFI